jgi:hypothetical protein
MTDTYTAEEVQRSRAPALAWVIPDGFKRHYWSPRAHLCPLLRGQRRRVLAVRV